MANINIKDQIHSEFIEYLSTLGYTVDNGDILPPDILSKDDIRRFHIGQRREVVDKGLKSLGRSTEKLISKYFADGTDVNPALISPTLIRIDLSDSWEGRLFRLASLLWNVPVTTGYGRRMRYLVIDEHNEKLIGIFALKDPVFNLAVRDRWVGWNGNQRKNKLVDVMDAYVIGAVPPYSYLLGGKLVASLVASQKVAKDFSAKYSKSKGIISNKSKKPKLAMITTTSALGRSSIYNRLRVGDIKFNSVGFTDGWGHFHVSDEMFIKLRSILIDEGHQYANGYKFGNGPNWRIRVIRAACSRIGIPDSIIRHGVQREVFVVPLGVNSKEFLKGEDKKFQAFSLSTEYLSDFCKERWILPRTAWDMRYQEVQKKQILDKLYD